MTQKTYTAKTCISVNVSLDEYISATIIFEPQIDGSSKFVTTDENIQEALEANSNYGKLFKLTDTTTVSDSVTEPKVSRSNKEEYTSIPEETNARKKADAALGKRINDETTARQQADAQIVGQSVSDVDYDASTRLIRFYNANNEVIATLDSTPFVIDAFVTDVEIVDTDLVITFKTTQGEVTINIPIASIFDPSNYYTKDQVDALDYDVITDAEMDEVLG